MAKSTWHLSKLIRLSKWDDWASPRDQLRDVNGTLPKESFELVAMIAWVLWHSMNKKLHENETLNPCQMIFHAYSALEFSENPMKSTISTFGRGYQKQFWWGHF